MRLYNYNSVCVLSLTVLHLLQQEAAPEAAEPPAEAQQQPAFHRPDREAGKVDGG